MTLLNEEDGSTDILPLAPIALNTYTYTLATDGISNGLQYSISIQPVTKNGGVDIFGVTSASIATVPFGVPIISSTVIIQVFFPFRYNENAQLLHKDIFVIYC